MAGWLMFRSRAARPRLPVCATLRKYRSSRSPSAFSRASLCRVAGSASTGNVTAFIRWRPLGRTRAAPGQPRHAGVVSRRERERQFSGVR